MVKLYVLLWAASDSCRREVSEDAAVQPGFLKERQLMTTSASSMLTSRCTGCALFQPASHVLWPQKNQCVGLSHPRSDVHSPWTPSSAPTFWASGHEMLMGPSPAVPMTRPPRPPYPGKSLKASGPSPAHTSAQHPGAAQTTGKRLPS